MNGDRPRLGRGAPGGSPGLLTKVLTFAAGAVVLVAALLFSFVLFVVLAAVGLIAGAWLWWQTRELRGQLREQMRQAQQRGGAPDMPGSGPRFRTGRDPRARDDDDNVIEGDYVREAKRDADSPPGASTRRPGEDGTGDSPRR